MIKRRFWLGIVAGAICALIWGGQAVVARRSVLDAALRLMLRCYVIWWPERQCCRSRFAVVLFRLVPLAGAGAYCAAMATINYNSYPQAPEVMREPDGTPRLLRRRQRLEQVWENEV